MIMIYTGLRIGVSVNLKVVHHFSWKLVHK
jgi:hypothetical protein